ncbi:MAG TPA: citrate synthase [Chitinispirillaceae bacterium]|nr:citrate synthase [Chitinispirillaceae bacterium]
MSTLVNQNESIQNRQSQNAITGAKLIIGDKETELSVVESTAGPAGINISQLRELTGVVTYDNGMANTAVCRSSITYVDGERGQLMYRGYDIESLTRNCTFVEVAYLLVHGKLPIKEELLQFSRYLNEHSLIHEDMQHFFTGFPPNSHPMSILSAMVTSLFSFYPHIMEGDPNFDITAARLISKVRTIAAYSYKKSRGEPIIYPRQDLTYCANFLNMMFSSPVKSYDPDPVVVSALNKLLIMHADHEQNASTSAVRLVASARGNLYAAISAGISALWGELHGGANQAVIEMLQKIKADNSNVTKYINLAKDKSSSFRLMGFGHAVYKNYDPRAKLAKELCDTLLPYLKIDDPLLEIAAAIEEIALKDEYFISRKLYPNIDFYTGILYRAIGIPTNMLTVMFAIGRLPGWIAHWKETAETQSGKIYRPRQVYVGPEKQSFIKMEDRLPG